MTIIVNNYSNYNERSLKLIIVIVMTVISVIVISFHSLYLWHVRSFKDSHREKAPSNKNPVLPKRMKMDICVGDTSNQLFTKKIILE